MQEPNELLQTHSADLSLNISPILCSVTEALHAKQIISIDTKDHVLTASSGNYDKAIYLMHVLQQQLRAHSEPKQYLIKICQVLGSQQHCRLTEIASILLRQLGVPSSHFPSLQNLSLLPHEVQQYCSIIKERCIYQPIIAADWPPRVGKEVFGRLALAKRKNELISSQQNNWLMLRGRADKICSSKCTSLLIKIEDILSGQPLTVVIDGPPGIGKTTLCRKVLNMWANGQLPNQNYTLLLYCSLRKEMVANANTLEDLLQSVYQSPKVTKVVEWLTSNDGKGLLIIFDGWDELSKAHKRSSFVARIIRKELLHNCSVIVTSRSYATSSLLESISDVAYQHIEVVGFVEEEIMEVVKGQMEAPLAEKFIAELKVRSDIQSICYIPLICSMAIFVYQKTGGELPATLTEMYENFILQTIRRHIKNHTHIDIEPTQLRNLSSLRELLPTVYDSFKEICQFAYFGLKQSNPMMAFSLDQLQFSLNKSSNENYIGLLTKVIVYDDEMYQFIHLTIQEFLAAWWIVHYENTTEVFSKYFHNDNFKMCLRFIAGLTHLKSKCYQQYFDRKLDLCKKKPIFGYEVQYFSRFRQQEKSMRTFSPSCDNDEKLDFFLLQLLYESQNTDLCKVLAKSIKSHSLSLKPKTISPDLEKYEMKLTLFNILCLGYFLNHSEIEWHCLDMKRLNEQQVQVLSKSLKSSNQCRKLEIEFFINEDPSVNIAKLFELPFYSSVQEIHVTIDIESSLQKDIAILVELMKLPVLKVLDCTMASLYTNNFDKGDMDCLSNDLEASIATNSILNSLRIVLPCSFYIVDLVNGVARNQSISCFSLTIFSMPVASPLKLVGSLQNLLKKNLTLTSLELDIHDTYLEQKTEVIEVNTPLTSLAIEASLQLTEILPQYIKGLECLKLREICVTPIHTLFHSNPGLQELDIQLDTTESIIVLLQCLQSNATLTALRLDVTGSRNLCAMGHDLQIMLACNQTIQYFEIRFPCLPLVYSRYLAGVQSNETHLSPLVCSRYLSFLTAGVQSNETLKELRAPIPLSIFNIDEVWLFLKTVSQKANITELKLTFKLADNVYHYSTNQKQETMTTLFYKYCLRYISRMLQLKSSLRLFAFHVDHFRRSTYSSTITETVQCFLQSIIDHPLLEYVSFQSEILEGSNYKQKLNEIKSKIIHIT